MLSSAAGERKELCAALGSLVVAFGELEIATNHLIWVLINKDDPRMRGELTERWTLGRLGAEAKKAAKTIPDVDLQAAVETTAGNVERISTKRNDAIHAVTTSVRGVSGRTRQLLVRTRDARGWYRNPDDGFPLGERQYDVNGLGALEDECWELWEEVESVRTRAQCFPKDPLEFPDLSNLQSIARDEALSNEGLAFGPG